MSHNSKFVHGYMSCVDEFRHQKAVAVHQIKDMASAVDLMRALNEIESAIVRKLTHIQTMEPKRNEPL